MSNLQTRCGIANTLRAPLKTLWETVTPTGYQYKGENCKKSLKGEAKISFYVSAWKALQVSPGSEGVGGS